MIPLFAIIIGLLVGLLISFNLPSVIFTYLAIVVLITISQLLEGIKLREEKRFTNLAFLVTWISQILVALAMNALGDALALDLLTPLVIIIGIRIFLHASKLSKLLVERLQSRQKTIKVWMEKTGQSPEQLPIENIRDEKSPGLLRVEELREQAKRLRLEADSLINEADVLFEEEAMRQLILEQGFDEEASEIPEISDAENGKKTRERDNIANIDENP